MRAQFVLSEIWIGLRRTLPLTVAVTTTVAIALALFGGGLLINQQVSQMRQYWDERVTLTIYMCTDISNSNTCEENGPATDQQRQDVQSQLESMSQVQSVEYVDSDEAYKDFKERFANNEAMVDAVRKGDIPDNFRVQLANPQEYQAVSDAVTGAPGIDTIYDDQAVLEQFFGLLDGLTTAALTVAFVQLAAAALLIGNTVRLAAYNRRKETGIMRLVGA